MPYITMAGAIKMVAAHFQPQADKCIARSIDASGANGAAAAVVHIHNTIENLNPEINAQAAMGGVQDEINGLQNDMSQCTSKVDGCNQKIAGLNDEIGAVVRGVNTWNSKCTEHLGTLSKNVNTLSDHVTTIATTIGTMQSKVVEIENSMLSGLTTVSTSINALAQQQAEQTQKAEQQYAKQTQMLEQAKKEAEQQQAKQTQMLDQARKEFQAQLDVNTRNTNSALDSINQGVLPDPYKAVDNAITARLAQIQDPSTAVDKIITERLAQFKDQQVRAQRTDHVNQTTAMQKMIAEQVQQHFAHVPGRNVTIFSNTVAKMWAKKLQIQDKEVSVEKILHGILDSAERDLSGRLVYTNRKKGRKGIFSRLRDILKQYDPDHPLVAKTPLNESRIRNKCREYLKQDQETEA